MPEPGARRPHPRLATRILFFSIASYIVLIACIILLFDLGVAPLGVPGRVPELLGLEAEYLETTLAQKKLRVEGWMATALANARAIARLESTNPELALLAAAGKVGPDLRARRLAFERKYGYLVESSPSVSRLFILRREDRVVLVDTLGLDEGRVFPLAAALGSQTSGQFRLGGDLYSFGSAFATNGASLSFVLVTPLASLLRDFLADSFDTAKGLGSALADSQGRLFSPFTIPSSSLAYIAGAVPVDGEALSGIARGALPVLLLLDGHLVALGSSEVKLISGETLYVVAARARGRIIGDIQRESAAMALAALLLAAAASLLAQRYVRQVLAPLTRLHAEVEGFGRAEPAALAGEATGEVEEITRAFSKLVKRVGTWRTELEAEVEARTRMLRLTAELCGIYARDSSETANVAAVDILKTSFKAEAAALLYVNGKREFRICLAGIDVPVALEEGLWRANAGLHVGEGEVSRFGPWSPPIVEGFLPFWMSCRLYASGSDSALLFLGREGGNWSPEEEADLVAVVRAIAPIVQVRRERGIEEQERLQVEERLAANELRLRSFFEGSRDMIYTADARDRITGINAAGLALLGMDDRNEVVGQPFAHFALNPEDRGTLLAQVRELGYAADYEIVLRGREGKGVFCLETAYAIRDAEGGVVELQGIIKDITERIASENALWKSNIELADANLKIQRTQALMVQHEKLASIGQLAAGVAHEINNPLGFLKSNHAMLAKFLRTIRQAWEEVRASPTPDPAAVEKRRDLPYLFSQLDLIFSESDDGFARIMHIVGNLKSFSRIDPNADFAAYDVNAGIESTLIVARNEIKYVAEVKLELGELPLVRAMGSEINQVILNILVNAAQAIEGQARGERGLIEIRTVAEEDRVVIAIHDDGPGIPDSLKLRVFDPFFTTKEPGKGTGLGLSISYDIIVSKHGGSLSVDSREGEGTTFTIGLPIAGPDAKEGEAAASP
jgi:PAS domain S-box-containing protein